MELYHGTDEITLKVLIKKNIDVQKGGGELGQGFYCGDTLWRAKQWAVNKHNSSKVFVVRLIDDEFLKLDPLLLNKAEAIKTRNNIRRNNQTRTYKFGHNAVWAPVVGIPSNNFNQVKFESKNSQNYLNGSKVNRKII